MNQPDWIETARGAFRYALQGEGPGCLALIHELAGSLDSWAEVAVRLPDGLRVLRYDQRGCGQSEKVRGALTLDEAAADLEALLAALGIAGPLTLVGAAVGCAVAVAFADRHPERVARMVLIGPALAVPAERQAAALATAARLEEGGMRAIASAVLPLAFPEALWSGAEAKARATARWLGADPMGYAAMYRMLVAAELAPALARLAMPVCVAAGRHDPFGTPEIVDRLTAALPRRDYRVLEAGHFAAVQSPAVVAETILDALDA